MAEFYIILFSWNIMVMLLYGADKRYAKKGKWRIKEATLIATAFLFGGLGAIAGMHLFRHKTTKIKFKLLIPLSIITNIALIIWIFKII